MRAKTKSQGFSLIELLIAVAIVGILAGIAYPSYAEYLRQTRRSDAHLALLQSVQSMERCRATSFTYVGCGVPAGEATSPEGSYSIALKAAATANAFILEAKPVTGSPQASDTDCTVISINQQGVRTPAACWE